MGIREPIPVAVHVAIDDVLDPMRVAVRMRSAFGRGDRPEHRRLLDLLRHGLRVIDEVGGHDL